MLKNGQTIGHGANQRVIGTPAQELARGERNARMQALLAAQADSKHAR